jgi:YHS domain-containing protein
MKKMIVIAMAVLLAASTAVFAAEKGAMDAKCAEHMKMMKKDCPMKMAEGNKMCGMCGLKADFKVKNTKKGAVIEITSVKDGDTAAAIQEKAKMCVEMMNVKTAAAATDDEEVICPVMGTKMKKSKAYSSTEYKGKMYYFCCAGCPEMFKKDPEKYINK